MVVLILAGFIIFIIAAIFTVIGAAVVWSVRHSR